MTYLDDTKLVAQPRDRRGRYIPFPREVDGLVIAEPGEPLRQWCKQCDRDLPLVPGRRLCATCLSLNAALRGYWSVKLGWRRKQAA